ncbi:hypothetical protein [Lacibacter sp.]|uniref:hypothetical protein n=1 Tax=Lacibacter sp. TaxID=1915409 RepID=UPI002B4AD24B|nr:hypothetical protein [Lacibacter sp.]HLP38555.1 hypothetical protein [Lacibacter sp.]
MEKKNIEQLKQKIYDQVAQLQDEVALQLLEEATEAYLSPNQKDIIDELAPAQIVRLNEAKLQVENAEVVSHDAVKAKSREWLTK